MGVLKAKFLEAVYENQVVFPWGGGGAKRKPSVGVVWIFSGTAHSNNNFYTLFYFQYTCGKDTNVTSIRVLEHKIGTLF